MNAPQGKCSKRNQRGNAVIEFALVLPLLLLVLFGITELGRMIMTTNMLNTASREGARLAAVGAVTDTLAVQARVTAVLASARITPTNIQITFNAAAHSVTVAVTANFAILSRSALPPALRGSIPLTGQTVFRYEG